MTTLQASSVLFSVGSSSSRCHRGISGARINAPKVQMSLLSLPKLQSIDLVELNMGSGYSIATTAHVEKSSNSSINTGTSTRHSLNATDPMVIAKLNAILEAVSDRVEMHKNIGEQRDNWNRLLLTSINAITLTAATMTGLAAATNVTSAPLMALKVSSTILYIAATGMLVVMNKIQPSQLAEEQRNASRLFKQLQGQIQTMLSLRNLTISDVIEAMEKVLALDKAYPLPLLGTMLDKFPSVVEPAEWWPQQRPKQGLNGKINGNGWSKKLEEELREISGVSKRQDLADYLRLSKIALKVNSILAISGPLLTGLAALGSSFVGTSHCSWAVMLGVIGGALASVVNAMEHGGQVGMVFEMYRSNAGFFKLMEETIESNISERDVERRENGEVFELKVALQLGRSLSELRHLATSSRYEEATEEFACKLF